MSAGWIAGTVRAHALVSQLPGQAVATVVASSPSVAEAAGRLRDTAYADHVRGGASVTELQRGIAGAVLWQLRVLAGWLPFAGAALVRVLAGWFEARVIEERLVALRGAEVPAPFVMGRLGIVATKAASANSAEALRRLLASSIWGDPGEMTPARVHAYLQGRWAGRVRDEAPAARRWVDGALRLVVARDAAAGRTAMEGSAATETGSDIWRAEARWWQGVEADARRLLRRQIGSPEVIVGACALIAADANRMSTALEIAARGGGALEGLGAAV